MKTCLSDDRPIMSLLVGVFWIATGTWHLYLWSSGLLAEFSPQWLFPLLAVAQYGLAVHLLRNGVSYRSERVQKLFEPNW